MFYIENSTTFKTNKSNQTIRKAISNQAISKATNKTNKKMTDVDISMFSTDSLKLTLLYSLVNKSTGGSCNNS